MTTGTTASGTFYLFNKKEQSSPIVFIHGVGLTHEIWQPQLDFFENYSSTIGLWFSKFEFNASFYYLFREIGYLFTGYNEISIIGKITALCTVVFILILGFFRRNNTIENLFISMLFSISFYYFFSSTVHPWYVATPLLLCIFTKYRFPIYWSFVVILSYHAYSNSTWNENLFLVAFQYILLFFFIIYDSKKQFVNI